MSAKTAIYKNVAVGFVICVLIMFSIVVLNPLPVASTSNCVKYSGVVTTLSSTRSGDIVITLKDDFKQYYIYNGVEQGFTVGELKEKLEGKTIDLLAVRQWTLLDPGPKASHVAQITVDGSVIYDEINQLHLY
jgi:hypothetical protein